MGHSRLASGPISRSFIGAWNNNKSLGKWLKPTTDTDGFVSQADDRAKQSVRARHETVNWRLKKWGYLKQVWCHDRWLHKTVFAAVAVITQLAFKSDEPPYQCRYQLFWTLKLSFVDYLILLTYYLLYFLRLNLLLRKLSRFQSTLLTWCETQSLVVII